MKPTANTVCANPIKEIFFKDNWATVISYTSKDWEWVERSGKELSLCFKSQHPEWIEGGEDE